MTNSKNKSKHIIHDNGNEEWYNPSDANYNQDKDLPAEIHPDGTEIYYKNGKYYREFGPKRKYPDGYELWSTSKNYLWHREDGATVILSNGERKYYINGKPVSYDKFRKQH